MKITLEMRKGTNRIALMLVSGVALALLLIAPLRVEALTSIATCAALQDMSSNLTEDYALSGNIDCTGFDPDADGKGFIPVGTIDTPFEGTFNGAGFTISGLTIARPAEQRVGLFGHVNGGTYQNVTLAGSVEGLRRVGSLIGSSDAAFDLAVTNVRSSVDVTGHGATMGGIVGYAGQNMAFANVVYSGTLTNATDLSNIDNMGGIIGYADGVLSIASSSVTGNIVASTTDGSITDAGGLAGYVFDALTVASSSMTGTMSVIAQDVLNIGGLVGEAIGTAAFTASYSTGNMTIDAAASITAVGGLIAYPSSSGSMARSYATGNMTIDSATNIAGGIGGLVGSNSGIFTISDSYKTGNITVVATGNVENGVGGIIGGYFNGNLARSHAYGSINISAGGFVTNGVGGLVGYVGASTVAVSNSFYSGHINATSTASLVRGVGGAIGHVAGFAASIATSYSNATTTVSAVGTASHVGGLIGYTDGFTSVTGSFAAGPISVTSSGGNSNIGAVLGDNSGGTLTNSHYDKTLSTLSFCTGADDPDPAGCTAIENDSAYFKGNDSNDPLDTWNFSTIWLEAYGQYPSLLALPSPYGTPETEPAATSTPASTPAPAAVSGRSSASGFTLMTPDLLAIFGIQAPSPASSVQAPSASVSGSSGSGSCSSAIPGGGNGAVTGGAHIGFMRNLQQNSRGEDVRQLQCFLNTRGFTVSRVGAGSSGRETTLFGPATKAALIRFQKAHGIKPAVGFFGPVTRGAIKAKFGVQ